ncbi:MAG TPA: MOSC domain-containing protein [Candidatus Eisenbacteria bacterium]|uniref:MOSC domain-containing protein n=1 Tax=Eiseniibacteriota bacterium TaxID=2212470 RepID=A0A7V2AVX8_UNCEI|nr:MOSC domain-containing protein [Candidatus Eisenbacteria bacterium]
MVKEFAVVSVNISAGKGEMKKPAGRATLRAGHGMEGDAHAGDWHRQVSLLAMEDIEYMRGRGADVSPGDFAENITTRGIDLPSLPIGTRLRIGGVELEVTQIGKECHRGCAILEQTGECVMPKRGIFARVLKGGEITHEDTGSYDI